jgi:translation initiation factor 1
MNDSNRVTSLADLYKLVPGAEPPADNAPKPAKDPLQRLVTLRVRLETKGRKGKGMTVISGFHHTAEDLADLARALKTLCGAGGTVRDDTIEIQGDHRTKIIDALKARGFTVKGG